MKCPHCLAELKYVDRPKRTCSHCRRQFALEPRENKLKLSDLKLRGLAEWLSCKGAYRYTAAHLVHAAIRQWLKPSYDLQYSFPHQMSFFGCILMVILLILVFCLLIPILLMHIGAPFAELFIAFSYLIAGVLACILLLLTQEARYTDPKSFQFETLYVEPWQAIHGPLPGLIDRNEIGLLWQNYNDIPIEATRAFVVSPVEDVLDCLLANELPQRLCLVLINLCRSDVESQIALVRQHPHIPILVIHDASIAGCLLPSQLPQQWQLTPSHRVIDLGLHPTDVKLRRLPWRRGPIDKSTLELLHQAQSTGASTFSDDDMKWFAAGSMSSVLFLPPAQLIRRVAQTVAQYGPPELDPKAAAQARTIGFMTWPQPSA